MAGLPKRVRAVAVSAGAVHALVLGSGSDGRPYGVGVNTLGQLTGATGARSTLTRLTGLPHGVAATAGFTHSLALGSNGAVYGTGLNDTGQLGGARSGPGSSLTALTLRTLVPINGLPAATTGGR